jgi:hypothetical protein
MYYVGGIETVKVSIRIYSNRWHVYAGLAILNPSARAQIDQYASGATDPFKLIISGDEDTFRERVYNAREKVFGVDGDAVAAERQRRTPNPQRRFPDQFSLARGRWSATPRLPADQSSATSTHAATAGIAVSMPAP